MYALIYLRCIEYMKKLTFEVDSSIFLDPWSSYLNGVLLPVCNARLLVQIYLMFWLISGFPPQVEQYVTLK